MNPRNSTASFSHREQRRRNPFKRRNTRSIAVRRLYPSRSYAQGPTRGRRGAPTGSPPPLATVRCQGLAPSSARAQSSARLSGGRPRRVSPWRPAGAAGAGAGESAKARAVRASAATRRLLGGPAPRDRPREGKRFCERSRPGGRDLDEGAG